jgi:hypothetical protein
MSRPGGPANINQRRSKLVFPEFSPQATCGLDQ